MLQPLKQYLKSKTIVLASASPRRKKILEHNLGLQVKVVPSTFPENLDKNTFATHQDYVIENAKLKALEVANNLKNEDWFLIIGADTVVALNNTIYEKPTSKENAFEIIKSLSNRTHTVSTGVSLIKKSNQSNGEFVVRTFCESTEVDMPELADDVIRSYIDTNEPMDKAGGYGIQDLGSSLVKAIRGDFYNVEGFPVHKFAVELKQFLQ